MYKCETCDNEEVAENVRDFSIGKYDGHIYCFDCQKKQPGVSSWKGKADKAWKGTRKTNGSEFDPTSCLTSYAKDLTIAMLDKIEAPKNQDLMDGLWERANKHVWDSYQFFKEKLK